MNNIVYSILPFILFGFICAVLTRRRFSKTVTPAVWIAVMAVLAGVHLGVGLASYDSSVIIALMPVTAYLPVIIALFILSRRSLSGNIFVVSVALLADVIAALVRKLCIVYVFGYIAGGIWASVLCAAIVAAVCVAIGFVVFRFLRVIFRGGNIVENNSWFILFVTLLPVVLSLYQLASVADVTGTILLLSADVCVFAVTVAYIVVKHKNISLQTERADIERQIELEREEYRMAEQKLELGRRYRHDMRHHFAAIRGLLKQGDTEGLEEYLNSLDDGLSLIGQRAYCKNKVVNAVFSSLAGRAERAGIALSARMNIPDDAPFESSDLSIVVANALENSINACADVARGAASIEVVADCSSDKFAFFIENSVASAIALGEDGLPLSEKTEEHGYGMSSICYIVEKYSGMLECKSTDNRFSVRLVLFSAGSERPPGPKKRRATRACAAVPLTFIAAVLALNCMPATVNALEGVLVLGDAIAAVDFRTWGFGWGDSQLNVTYPQTGDDDVDKTISDYIDECVDEFLRYLGLGDQGYVGADIVNSVIADTVDMCTIRVSCTINAGSSVDERRYYVIDKSLGRIAEFAELFEEDSDYISVISAEISRRIAARVEAGEFFYGYGIWTERPLAVLDDDREQLAYIVGLLEELSSSSAVPLEAQTFDDPFELLDCLERNGGFDLYILDVLMSVISGMEVAERIRARGERCEIIFLTMSREYGVEAFGVNAAGYLLKPVSAAEFDNVASRAIARLGMDDGPPVLVKTGGGLRRLLPSEIVLIESFNHHREIALSDGHKIVTPETLSSLREALEGSPAFYSPHRAYIVNLDYVSGIQDGNILVRGMSLPVAKQCYRKFRQYYLDYCFKK